MRPNPKCAIAVITALVLGLLVGRGFSPSGSPATSPAPARTSKFENDALGFLNWFRIEGRAEISHEVLIRNLQILESKAIASGKLLAFKSSESNAEQVDAVQPATAVDSKAEGGKESKPESEGRSK